MKDQWTLMEVRPSRSPQRWFFRKNLVPSVGVANTKYSWLAYLTFTFEPKNNSGLPTSADESLLVEIEDREVSEFESDGLAVQVTAVLRNGVKDLLFYTHDADAFLDRAEKFRERYSPRFGVGCEVMNDPSWSQYLDFP